jgi:hypothetical protein
VLCHTSSLTAAERQEFPLLGMYFVPALRFEGLDVGSEDGGVAVQCVVAHYYCATFGDEDWCVLVFAAAEREGGVAEGDAGEDGEDGV